MGDRIVRHSLHPKLKVASLNRESNKVVMVKAIRSIGRVLRFFPAFLGGVLFALGTSVSLAQVAPLAPRWLAGDPPPPVETFADGLARHHIEPTEAALIAALHDPDGEARSLAAAQLAATDDHAALPAITRALEDERDPQVQVNLAGAATWLGSRRGVDQLQRICQDVNVPSTARLDAARYVSHRELAACFPAIDQIERTDPDANVRVLAVQAAVSYRGESDKAEALAVSALTDVEPTVRIAAADALRSLRAKRAIGALEGALKIEGDETAREHLRETLRVLRLPDDKR
jgi:HEAT repeat protein